MVAYASNKLKNVCVAGHGTTGKTTLVESLMFNAGVINRQGAVEDGNTVTDFVEEEVGRGISISTAVASAEYKDQLLTFVDTPGYFDFVGEQASALPFAETTLLTIRATSGLDVGTEKAFEQAGKSNRSRAFFVTDIDKENIEIDTVVAGIESDLGIFVAPISYPVETGLTVDSVLDVLNGKVVKYSEGKMVSEEDPTGDIADKLEEFKREVGGISCRIR